MKTIFLICLLLSSPDSASAQNTGARSGTVVFKRPQTCAEAFEILTGTAIVPRCQIGDLKSKRAYTVSMVGTVAGSGFDRIRKHPQVQSFTPDSKKSKL